MSYTRRGMEVRQTPTFAAWLARLRDPRTKAVVLDRLLRLQAGHLGDWKALGDGLGELRIAFGPGLRLYFVRRGDILVILLCAGDKGSQGRDIRRAKAMVLELEDDTEDDPV